MWRLYISLGVICFGAIIAFALVANVWGYEPALALECIGICATLIGLVGMLVSLPVVKGDELQTAWFMLVFAVGQSFWPLFADMDIVLPLAFSWAAARLYQRAYPKEPVLWYETVIVAGIVLGAAEGLKGMALPHGEDGANPILWLIVCLATAAAVWIGSLKQASAQSSRES